MTKIKCVLPIHYTHICNIYKLEFALKGEHWLYPRNVYMQYRVYQKNAAHHILSCCNRCQIICIQTHFCNFQSHRLSDMPFSFPGFNSYNNFAAGHLLNMGGRVKFNDHVNNYSLYKIQNGGSTVQSSTERFVG